MKKLVSLWVDSECKEHGSSWTDRGGWGWGPFDRTFVVPIMVLGEDIADAPAVDTAVARRVIFRVNTKMNDDQTIRD